MKDKKKKAPMSNKSIYRLMLLLVYIVAPVYLIKNIIGGAASGAITIGICLAVFAGVFEMVARAVVVFVFVPKLGYRAACFANPSAWIMADIFLIPAYFYCVNKLKKRIKNEDYK